MYLIWDKWEDQPWSKEKYGHFKIYQTKKAAQAALYRQTTTNRCEVIAVSMVAFERGGFI